MRYYSEVDVSGNLIEQRVCQNIDDWTPRHGIRLVMDEMPEYNSGMQTVVREAVPILGDSVPYKVIDLDNGTGLPPEYITKLLQNGK